MSGTESLRETALGRLDTAPEGKLKPKTVENIREWLTEPYYAEYVGQLADDLAAGRWEELDEAFWKTIPFGTGGRRGRMYPVGTNAINDRTIGESALGLAEYVKNPHPRPLSSESPHPRPLSQRERGDGDGRPLSCAIAYDTRHRSRHFAELCSEIMVAAGFKVFFLDGFRSTPELSFAVRYKNCDCGIIVTASHNPPSDNAVKAYWKTGGQLVPPDDKGVIECAEAVREIPRVPFEEAKADGRIVYCQEEVDAAFLEAVKAESHAGPRDVKIIYSPLHGVGATAVCPVLAAVGFDDVELYARHAEPDPDFPNVPGHSANPENPRVFDEIIDRAKQTGAELIMATDPDADRLGCAVPKSLEAGADWIALTGNQIGALLADYLLGVHKAAGTLKAELYVVKTLVTTELIRRVADDYGVQTAGNLQVGFKWIGQEMDLRGPENFVFGAEESYGFLAGTHVRDKDGAVAAMLLAELAAQLKAEGLSLYEKLLALFRKYGCHDERTISVMMPGASGMDRMKNVMAGFRDSPPNTLGGLAITRRRDYLSQTVTETGGQPHALDCSRGDMVILELEAAGNYIAVRPSGTEPKVKFYMFAFDPAEESADPRSTLAGQAERLDRIEKDLRAFAGV